MIAQSESRDEGFTLVEVLVAMLVLGIGVAALMTAMGMHVKTSAANRNQSAAAATLATASEYAKSYPWNPPTDGTCPLISHSVLPLPPAPAGYTISYSDGQAMPPASQCELQKITVHVSGFGYDLQVDVAKRAQVEVTP